VKKNKYNSQYIIINGKERRVSALRTFETKTRAKAQIRLPRITASKGHVVVFRTQYIVSSRPKKGKNPKNKFIISIVIDVSPE
jgi:hypothetical protein